MTTEAAIVRKCWTLKPGCGVDSLQLKETPSVNLEPGRVRVSIQANSINHRDIMAAIGQSPLRLPDEIIPVSDGAGVVTEVGEGVTHFLPGDRVVIAFNPSHQDGPFHPHMAFGALGEVRPGVLASEVVLEETALVKLPENISFAQAACLPCVAVTAWNALFEIAPLMPGQTVLAVGTGTVALTALQFAKAAGARVGITSSSNEKLERAKAMGADFTHSYRENPHWSEGIKKMTGGKGVDVVLETAGPPSIAESIRACRHGGRVMQIGLKGLEGPPINLLDLLVGGTRVFPVMVGSRAILERVVAAVSHTNLTIPISQQFSFQEVPSAFAAFMSPRNFGKTVILQNESGVA